MNQQYMMEGFNNTPTNQRAGKSVADIHNQGIDTNMAARGFDDVDASTPDNATFSTQPLTQHFVERFYEPNPDIDTIVKNADANSTSNPNKKKEPFQNYAELNEQSSLHPDQNNKEFQSCFPRDRLTASDLLPKDAADSKWARLNPSGTGDIHDQNYLTAGYHIGINTVGQSLRNANLQLRSEIPNPQTPVGPWMISTIEPDLRQNTLEIGSSPSY